MKKRILSILLCCVMLVGLLPTAALAAGPDVWDGSTKAPSGSGSESAPYLISTGEELAWLATLAAERSYYVQLTNDIILNDGTFDQSGNFTKTGETAASTPHAWTPAKKAVWHIDGGNHYISGLYINSNDNDDVGLFSNLRGGSYVKNLTIKNSYVTASQSDKFFGVGVFAGQSSSNFTNCAGENNIVSASRYATGGIVGYSNSGSFNGVHTSGSISGGKGLGGLVGWVFGDTVFKNCWNEAIVSSGNASGGILGTGGNHSDLYNCANLGSGGITGSTARIIKNCYNLSEVDGYGGADKLLTTLNEKLYEMDGISDLNNWVMGTGGYPLPTGERFVDTTVYYDVWLNGVRVGERNQNDILKNGLASYDKNTKTLYLHDGLVVTNPYNKRLLYTEGDINLCVDGSVEFRSAQKVGSGPIVIDLGEVGGSGNLKIYAPTGKSAAVTVTCEQSEYGIDVRSLTLDGDVSLTVRTKDTPCFANCNTITLLSSEAVLDAENGDEDGRSMLNSVSKVILPRTNPQKLYEGIGAELDCVEQFTTQDDNGYDCMYPHIRIAPEVYTLIDTLPKSLTVSMTEANTQTALSTWAAGEIRKGDITASNSEITVSDVVPAVAGSETNQSGTDGSFTVTVKLTQNGISKTTTIPGTITATAYVPPHTHCICGGETDVGDHTSHTDVIYQPWDGTSAIDYGDDNTAYVCLTDNVTIQSNLEIEAGKTLYLCLNGKTFASNGTTKIEMRENSHFILCDCAGGGTIDGADSCWGGAGIYLHNSTMDMYGGKITGGHTGNGGGGAIALDDVNCVFNMYGGEISGNKADRYAGAIFLNGTLQSNKGGTVNLYGGTIKNNSAQLGGAIYAVYGGTVNLFCGEISGNKATVNGGGAICLNHSGVLNMTGGKMQNNTAKTDGGAVNLFASTFTFSDGTISNNYSAEYGGAVYLSISGKLNMTGGEICNNTAKEEGGAVHVYGENATFNFSGGKITGNEAVDGGAVYLNQENSTLNMTGGEISGNKAARNGGAVYMFRATSTLNLSGGTIKNNTAGSSGGAVYFNTTSDGKIQGILNISGNPVVKDNTVSDKANNISLKSGKTLSIVAAMTDGASVGITTESTDYPVVFSNAYDTDYSGYFFADDANAYVRQDGRYRLELATGTPHTHSWATAWSKDEAHHWHECTADGCDVTNDADKNGYAAHTYDQEIATADYKASDATCTAKATYYKSCICGEKGTETFESGEVNASNHTFGAWIGEVPATCKTTGTKGHKDCTGCNKHFAADGSEITDLTIPVNSANHEGSLGDWVKTDPDKHWKEYSCCGAKVEEGTHVYTDDTDTTCNTCNYERTVTPSHTHSWETTCGKDDTHHWHECTADGCDVTENSEKNGYGEHDYDDDADTTCNTCGYTRTVEPPAHTHSWATEWTTDDTHHWHECTAEGCDVTENSGKDGYGAHDYDNDTDTDCNTCGYIRTITPSHTHSWDTAWSKNETHHWHECTGEGCDVTENSGKDGYGAHDYDDDADTTCNTCGYERTITPSHTHSWAEDWSKNETHHWHECTADGCDVTNVADKDDYGAHVYDNDADTDCNTCGYIRTVEPPAHTHSWATEWNKNETHHWHECTAEGCNVTEISGKNGYGAHDYTDDADTECNTCGYVRTISGGGGGTHYPAYHGPVQPALVLPPRPETSRSSAG